MIVLRDGRIEAIHTRTEAPTEEHVAKPPAMRQRKTTTSRSERLFLLILSLITPLGAGTLRLRPAQLARPTAYAGDRNGKHLREQRTQRTAAPPR